MYFDAKTLGIRDIKDAREAGEKFADIRRMQQSAPAVGARGGRNDRYPRIGARANTAVMMTAVEARKYEEECRRGRTDAPDCDVPPLCHTSILGFNSLETESADFPIVGGAGTVAEGSITVSSGNAGSYKATDFFFEGRDSASGFAVVPTLLTSAVISGSEQLVGTGGEFGITSAVFALTNEPLPVGWKCWQDSGQQRLILRFGNFLAVGVTIEVFGVFWGDRVTTDKD